MALIDRIRGVIMAPAQTLPQIAAEPATVASLYQQYVIPLAAIPAIASFIGLSLIGVSAPFIGTFRYPILSGIVNAVVSYVLSLVLVYVLALVIDALAPSFGGTKDPIAALKTAVTANIPVWIAGILNIIPAFALLQLIAAIFACYLLYLGVQIFMRAPQARAGLYTAATIVVGFVLFFAVGLALGAVRVLFGGIPHGPMGTIVAPAAVADSATGTSYDEKRVTPVDENTLRALLPRSIDGMKRTSASEERSGDAAVSQVSGDYENARGGTLHVSISDVGNAKDVMSTFGLASTIEHHSNLGWEKNEKIGALNVHEKWTAPDNASDVQAAVNERFLIAIDGSDVPMATALDALGAIDSSKLLVLAQTPAAETTP